MARPDIDWLKRINQTWAPWSATAGLAVLSVMFVFLRARICGEYEPASLHRMMLGTAQLPFQYRALVPLALGALHAAGLDFGAEIADFWIDSAAVFAAALICRWLLGRLGVSRVWTLALFWMLGFNYIFDPGEGLNFRLCYDMPAVMFAFAAIATLRRKNHPGFYAILPLALLNRESAVCLSAVFALVSWREMSAKRWLSHLFIQGAICLAIRLAMIRLYPQAVPSDLSPLLARDWTYTPWHPGDPIPIEIRLVENAYRLARGEVLAVFGFFWVPLLFVWRRIPDPFFRAAAWLVPLMFVGMSLVANLSELRVFSEAIPVVLFGVAVGLAKGHEPGATGSSGSPLNRARYSL